MDMVGAWRWKSWWGHWRLRLRQLLLYQRLRGDYLKIVGLTSEDAVPWMAEEARLLILTQKEVENVGSELCQGELSD